jgi:outer membrane protein insertion porin family
MRDKTYKIIIALAVSMFLATSVVAVRGVLAQESVVIRQIVVTGLQRSSEDSVRTYLLVQEGDVFDPDRIDRSLKSLFATGRFANVAIRREGNVLVVDVVENPTVNRVVFEGNDDIKEETLESEVTLKPLGVYTQSKAQSDVRRILTLYRRSGRFAATVEPKLIELPQNRVDVIFEIDEGPVTDVASINFIGNKAFDDSDLRGVIRTKESRWWRFLSSEDTYDPDRLSLDRELLRRFYLSEGYADFRVQSAYAELSPDRQNFFLTFNIEEGERYKLGDVTVTSTLTGLEPDQLESVVEMKKGDWYDADQIEKTIDALGDEVGNLGYAFVEVQPQVQRRAEEKEIDVTFNVEEGPRVFVERIEISGNVRTKDKVIRREFQLAEGDAFNAAKLRRSRQRIQDLDYFERVDVDEVPGSAPDKAIIKVDVEEKSTGSLSLGAGFSTGSGVLGDISLRERNLLGTGKDVRASLLIGQRQQQVDLSLTEPYFLDREIVAGVDAFWVETDRQSESSFDTATIGSAVRAGYPLTEHLTQSWRYTLKQSDIKNVPRDASKFVKEAEGAQLYSEVTHSLLYDRRNSRITPSEGYFARLTTDIAGLGGDKYYARNRADAGYYYPIAEDWIASLTGAAGRIDGLGGKVDLLDRFFIGGAEVRGFSTDGIGPRDDRTGDALGGELFYSGSAQLTFPFGLPEELAIRGRVFTDVGSAWELDASGPQVRDDANPRVSVGTGITWVSPFGPLGVDFGFAVVKEDYDDTEIIRVNFGTRF